MTMEAWWLRSQTADLRAVVQVKGVGLNSQLEENSAAYS